MNLNQSNFNLFIPDNIQKMYYMTSLIAIILLTGCQNQAQSLREISNSTNMQSNIATDTATFGTGCFWCTEAVFESLEGVISATSGYSGGNVADPTYEQVCSGNTGHAECIQVVYDSKKISYDDLLQVFWESHDPTTLNKQGADVGTQYRSVIFYHNPQQKQLAESYKQKLNNENTFGKPVVTEIKAATTFYPAENYHQEYFKLNGHAPYCQFVIQPKVEKIRKIFSSKIKK